MDLTHKHVDLIHNVFNTCKNGTIREQYDAFKKRYESGDTFIILNNVNIFGPFPEPEVPWDISQAQKIATYNKDVQKVLTWIQTKIVLNLGCDYYKTSDVLIRIATGMLDKCNIPREYKILFQGNMVKNLNAERVRINLSELPF